MVKGKGCRKAYGRGGGDGVGRGGGCVGFGEDPPEEPPEEPPELEVGSGVGGMGVSVAGSAGKKMD